MWTYIVRFSDGNKIKAAFTYETSEKACLEGESVGNRYIMLNGLRNKVTFIVEVTDAESN